MATFLQQIAPFSAATNPAEAWADWRRDFTIFERACKYHIEDEETRTSLFLHVGGTEINEIYRTLTFPPLPDGCEMTLADVLQALDEHFRPYKNFTHASYMFKSL